MRRFAAPWALAAGCAVVVVTNAAILVDAWRNRSGEPEARIELTERELTLPAYRDRDDNSLFVTLTAAFKVPVALQDAATRRHRALPALELRWLNRDKLRGLGFDVALDPGDPRAPERYDRPDKRRVFVALEYDGGAWQRWIAGREDELASLRARAAEGGVKPEELSDAEALLAFDRTVRSHLVPIDAGRDPAALRRDHPDRARVVVVEGLVRLVLRRPPGESPELTGVVTDLLLGRVRVPREFRSRLDGFVPDASRRPAEPAPAWPPVAPPRFRATVALGARFEPWLVDVAVP